MVNKTMLR